DTLFLAAAYSTQKIATDIDHLNVSPSARCPSTSPNLTNLSNACPGFSRSGTASGGGNITWKRRLMAAKNDTAMSRQGIPAYTTRGFRVGYGTFLMKEGAKLGTSVATPQINPGEYAVWGNSQPKFNMSFSNNLTIYKNFDFSFLFDWKKG